MIEVNTVKAFRHLAGDALIAAGELVRGAPVRFPGITPADPPDFDDTVKIHDPDFGWHAPFEAGAMECDGPALSWPAPPPVTTDQVREALDELSDSTLFGICATIIEGWKPILFHSDAGLEAAVDVDVLVQALRDRRDQFKAVELDADKPFDNPAYLHAYQRHPSHFRGE